MRKLKTWKKIILGISIVVISIVGVAMVLLYNIGDRIISEMIFSELANGTPSLESLLKTPETPSNKNAENKDADEINKKTDVKTTISTTKEEKPLVGADNKNEVKQDKKEPSTVEEKPTTTEEKPATVEENPAPTQPNITTVEIAEVKDQVSVMDKIVAAELVVKRLSSDDIKKLNQIMEGGLTSDEKEEAKDIALERFSEAELEKIKAMYKKYMGQ